MTTKQLNGYRVEFYSEEEWNEIVLYSRTVDTFDGEVALPYMTRKDWWYSKCIADALVRQNDFGIFTKNDIEEANCFFEGKVSEIPEELAEKIVSSWQEYESLSLDVSYNGYIDYKSSSTYEYAKYPFKNAKDSFQTLSDLPYCVIIKN